MKKKRSKNSDKTPFPFEMPVNRLLTKAEQLVLISHGIDPEWIKCEACTNEGWTIDGRKYCSIKCYCREKGLSYNSLKLIKQAVYLDESAQEGDSVIYGEKMMKVIATDCAEERIKRGYDLKYNYALNFEGSLLRLKDLDTPLRKIKIEFDELDDNEYYE